MDGHISFGYWVRRQRKALDLTQAELALRVGCAEGTLRMIEGDVRRPSRQLATRLADQLAIAPGDHATFIQAARAQISADRLVPPLRHARGAPLPMPVLPSQRVQQPKDLAQAEEIVQSFAPNTACDAPSLHATARQRHNLPAQTTTLIGREREIQRVCAMLRRPGGRLVSLTGPGGIGKTRLALQVAAEILDTYTDGCYVVALASIRDPGLVAPAIAQALGLRETGDQPLVESLVTALRNRHMLLLLDNFEHVAVAAPLVSELLAAAPRLTVLVTSRASLRISGEHEVAVPPLTLPDRQEPALLERLAQYEAVRLFVARAEASDANFILTDANAAAVAEICRRLDGLPLAIELAAARIKLFAPQALLDRLTPRIGLLTGGPRDLPARQQTLRNTLDWSYQLLDTGEQKLFRRLAVFVAGSTLEAAEAICGDREPRADDGGCKIEESCSIFYPPSSILNRLAALVDQSLLCQTRQPNGEPRFTMLETTREYALEQLERAGELAVLRRQHARYYLEVVEVAELRLQEGEQRGWLALLEIEHDNLRSALAWSQTAGVTAEHSAETEEIGLRLAGALWWFWFVRGYATEGREWLAGALALTGSMQTALRAKALNGAAWLASLQVDFGAIAPLCEESLRLSRALGDKRNAAYALLGLGWCAYTQNNHPQARRLFDEGLALARDAEDRQVLAFALHQVGRIAARYGEYESARTVYHESLTLAREQRNVWVVASNLFQLGKVARILEDYRRAQILLNESLALFQELGDPIDTGWVLNHLGNVARSQGDNARAMTCYAASLSIFLGQGIPGAIASVGQNLGYLALDQGDVTWAAAILANSLAMSRTSREKRVLAWSLGGLGGVAVEQGRMERAARLLGATEGLFEAMDHAIDPIVGTAFDRACVARAHLGDTAFAAAWTRGRAMTLEQAIDYALNEDM